MSRDEFTLRLGGYMAANPAQRYGQAVFNLAMREGLVPADYPGADWDPFYRDERVPAFLDHIFGKEEA